MHILQESIFKKFEKSSKKSGKFRETLENSGNKLTVFYCLDLTSTFQALYRAYAYYSELKLLKILKIPKILKILRTFKNLNSE